MAMPVWQQQQQLRELIAKEGKPVTVKQLHSLAIAAGVGGLPGAQDVQFVLACGTSDFVRRAGSPVRWYLRPEDPLLSGRAHQADRARWAAEAILHSPLVSRDELIHCWETVTGTPLSQDDRKSKFSETLVQGLLDEPRRLVELAATTAAYSGVTGGRHLHMMDWRNHLGDHRTRLQNESSWSPRTGWLQSRPVRKRFTAGRRERPTTPTGQIPLYTCSDDDWDLISDLCRSTVIPFSVSYSPDLTAWRGIKKGFHQHEERDYITGYSPLLDGLLDEVAQHRGSIRGRTYLWRQGAECAECQRWIVAFDEATQLQKPGPGPCRQVMG